MLTINVVTLFPECFAAPLAVSIPGRAAAAGLVRYRVVQLRDYTHDKHRTVDDAPYGGGAGMVLKPEPFFEAVEDLRAGPPIVLLSARGKPFTHEAAVRYAVGRELTLLCGHYKDVDQRVADGLGAEELSIGDYEGLLAPPSYTRPPEYRGMPVPDVLLSGDHERIAAWRAAEAERLTRARRPDLWAKLEDRG